jgi:hypothetical protein
VIVKIQEAYYIDGYRIGLRFNTGEVGEVDLSDLLRRYPAAQPLLDQDLFRSFYLDEWPTLAWPCGFDVAPETLYELATGKSPWRTDPICAAGSSPAKRDGSSALA